MRTYLRFLTAVLLTFCVGRADAADEWLREIDIKSEDAVDGQQDFTVRFLPGHTHQCEKVVFECVYQQKFPWTNPHGQRYLKVHEPVRFTYRRADVKLVNDLDHYVSFRVPVSLERLSRAYGDKIFNRDFPVTVARIVMKGIADGKTAWAFELPTPGEYVVKDVIEAREKRAKERRPEDLGDFENGDVLK